MNNALMAAIFDDYQQMKRQVVREFESNDRDIPMWLLVGENPSDEDAEVLCIIVPGARQDVCNALAAVMARAFTPYWAAICMDGFVAKQDDVPPEYLRAGGLVEMAASQVPGVRECLSITAADHTGQTYANSVTYWFDSDGDIWYDDDDGPGDKMSGPMIDVLVDITSLWGKSQTEIIAEIMKRSPDMN